MLDELDADGNEVRRMMTFLVMFSGVVARQIELHVPALYATIQAAIDAVIDGDSVIISPGVFSENVTAPIATHIVWTNRG